jgi:hypothetical protein
MLVIMKRRIRKGEHTMVTRIAIAVAAAWVMILVGGGILALAPISDRQIQDWSSEHPLLALAALATPFVAFLAVLIWPSHRHAAR